MIYTIRGNHVLFFKLLLSKLIMICSVFEPLRGVKELSYGRVRLK